MNLEIELCCSLCARWIVKFECPGEISPLYKKIIERYDDLLCTFCADELGKRPTSLGVTADWRARV